MWSTSERECFRVLDNGGEMKLVACVGKSPKPHSLEAWCVFKCAKRISTHAFVRLAIWQMRRFLSQWKSEWEKMPSCRSLFSHTGMCGIIFFFLTSQPRNLCRGNFILGTSRRRLEIHDHGILDNGSLASTANPLSLDEVGKARLLSMLSSHHRRIFPLSFNSRNHRSARHANPFSTASVNLRKARDEHLFSGKPPIAAGSDPRQHLSSAP